MSISLGVVSYGLAAIGFAALSLLLLPAALKSARAYWLIAAAVSSTIWAIAIAFGAVQNRLPLTMVYGVELIRDGFWLAALATMARAAVPRLLIAIIGCTWLALFVMGMGLPYFRGFGLQIVAPGEALLVRAGLLLALLGLVLLEQIYRNTPSRLRRQLTYLVLGIGGIFAYDLFLYSQAELFHAIEVDAWNVRGFVCLALSPIIVLAVRRNPEWPLEIFVSRQVVFYTGAIVSIGIYLLLMAFGGFYVREFGGEWGRIGQLLFFSGAVIVLLSLVFSVALRRHARVFIEKHFFKNKFDYRVEWLRFIGTMSSANEADVRRRALQAMTQIFGFPGGVLFLEDDTAQCMAPIAAWPMQLQSLTNLADLASDDSLCEFLRRRQWVVDVEEYRRYPERYDSLDLPESIAQLPMARILSPLIERDRLIGFALLFEPPPPFKLTFEDRDLLKTVGRHIATQIMQQQADRKLAESRQFEAYNQLTAFMMHDLKNSVAQLQLLVDNAARHKHNPEFIDDAVSTIANAVERMTRLIEQLKRGSGAAARTKVPIDDTVRKAIARCVDRMPAPQLSNHSGSYVVADAERLTAVFEHLIRNSQDATPANGRVWIEMAADAASVSATIHDTGSGMDAQFVRERLFRPFDSTKGSKGMGIGAYQVRQYARELGGDVEVRSSPGQGTRISLRLPIAPTPELRYSQPETSGH